MSLIINPFESSAPEPKKPNPDWVTVEGNFAIEWRRTGTERWVVWCRDNDIQVMHTRFLTICELLGRDASEHDAVRLVNTDTKQSLSSALFGTAAKEIIGL